ncbi:MAG: ankyrin repeat domain-containing protein [Bacteroidia bacterium]
MKGIGIEFCTLLRIETDDMEKALQIQRILNEGQGLAILKEKLRLVEDVNVTWGSGINIAHNVVQNSSQLPYSASDIVHLLKEVGVDLQAKNKEGQSPLHFGVSLLGSVEVVEALLGAGVNVDQTNNRGNSPLFDAVMQFRGRPGQLRKIELLLAAGANPDLPNLSGHTARSVVKERHQRLLAGIGKPEWDLESTLKW